MLHNPAVTGPIIGPRTVEQLGPGMRALELRLADDVLQELDRIWPGPGGEAPEAYAW
jgi:aryl-alcohol dehydrogenase-like predicted oxidoreductase